MSGIADAASEAAITAACLQLRLPTVRTRSGPMAETALRERLSYRTYLAEVLTAEVEDRNERRRQRRIKEARFPLNKRLEEFELAAAPTVEPAVLHTLSSLSFIDNAQPVVLIGHPGTGKSHLLIGLGVAACESGRRVRYVTTAELVNELVEAEDERRLSRIIDRYSRLDLLCLDELAYVHLDARGAELLFQIIAARTERSAIVVASNKPFSEWGEVFKDPRLAAAVVDRLTFRAHVIETGAESYRLRMRRRQGGRGRTQPDQPKGGEETATSE